MSRLITVVGTCFVLTTAFYSSPVVHAAPAQSARPADDLAAKVRARIDAEPDLKTEAITVTASSGVVTLQGEASSVIMRAKAGELALNTDGVRKVNNKLKLAKS